MSTSTNLYILRDNVIAMVDEFCLEHDVNSTLLWIMLRQQADHELRKLDDSNELAS